MKSVSLGLGALAAIGALAVPATANAADQITVTPSVTGKLGGPGAIGLTADIMNTDGGIPTPVTGLVADLPGGITLNLQDFPTCPLATVVAAVGVPPVCPAGSQIGSATAVVGAEIDGSSITEPAAARVYLTGKNPITAEVWANGVTPIAETLTFSGTLAPNVAPYGPKLTLDVPLIPTLPGGPDGSLVSITAMFSGSATTSTTETVKQAGRTVKKKVKTTVGEFTLPKTCSGAYRWAGTVTFQDGSNVSASGSVPCRA